MILPTKYIPLQESLLGRAAKALKVMRTEEEPMRTYFKRARKKLPDLDWSELVLILDLLFIMDLVSYNRGTIRRKPPC